jgi:hypothetical protein
LDPRGGQWAIPRGATLRHGCPSLNKLSSKAVETFQVIYDNLTEATGTAERLLEGADLRMR